MKKQLFLRCILALVTGLAVVACAGTPTGRETAGFEGVFGKDWKLAAIRGETGKVELDRAALEADGLGDAFTLRFEEERINGKGLPNRYVSPYKRGKGQAITFGEIAATLMASFKELEVLKEGEYFDYLKRAQSWGWGQDSLELHTTTPEGLTVVLVFVS
ncbi:MAG: META domain-containing protein [Spirochaetaceae bacterium]|jgi:heat shock protein HslJ|nr:META domain-containing protein [Spirochaetaceae bacterium]